MIPIRVHTGFSALAISIALSFAPFAPSARADGNEPAPMLTLNELDYLEMPGLNVMLAHDYYPEGHQGGVGIIQNGQRVATNGDIRLDRTPGQWQPVPKVGTRQIDRARQEISLRMEYPDPAKNRKGFNPVDYPDLNFAYTVRVRPEGAAFRITVDLESPLPDAFIGKVGFNLELFPGLLFGKSYYMDGESGIFPRQANGPGTIDAAGEYQIAALATGKKLTIAPESERQRMTIENALGGTLELVDGRGQYNNGWFVVRSLIARGATTHAVDWLVSPHAIPGFISPPTVQVSQVGYHPKQQKVAVIELDTHDKARPNAVLARISEDGGFETVIDTQATAWGHFLRYDYLQLDFTAVEKPGMYVVRYGATQSRPFKIGADVFARHVWQPTLDYFLPIQMCHMRVNDRYRVWHGACHLDDALMAPINHNHFDGYSQGPSTLCKYQPGEHVPGLDRGGWHDAGDYDLRIESQIETVHGLALAREEFGVENDNTTVDQEHRVVELNRPDGKPDILQQIEHGLLSIVPAYQSMGRLYRGIQEATMRQYTLLADPTNATDNIVFDSRTATANTPPVGQPGSADDRLVFTEESPWHELQTAAGLAAAARVMHDFNPSLAGDSLKIAVELYDRARNDDPLARVYAAVELLLTTKDRRYADFIVSQRDAIAANIAQPASLRRGMPNLGWTVGRTLTLIGDAAFTKAITGAVVEFHASVEALEKKTPYGVPYEPDIWGAGWGIQNFGMQQYFLHKEFPAIFSDTFMLHAMNFILGCHPGPNTSSFASGVGSKSATVAYGFNRADWTYIPGGSISGTALIRPDFPELLEWPYLWQQTEYVLGGGTTDYLFLVLAADHLLNQK